MGTLNDKLNYLTETKQKLREALEEMGATITDEDTFRSYAEKISELTTTSYITKYVMYDVCGVGELPEHTDLLGTYNPIDTNMICPSIIFDITEEKNAELRESNAIESCFIPFSVRGRLADYNAVVSNTVADYQNVKVLKSNLGVVLSLNMIRPKRLVLPTHILLNQYTLVNGSSGTDPYSFTDALIFGELVQKSTSTWINRTLNTTKRTVLFPKDFKLRAETTLYLSKIYIKKECLQEMVQNLYTYTDGTTRTISVGSTNKALLTTAEIKLANSKGWQIT